MSKIISVVVLFCYHHCSWLSKRNSAKFRELTKNFPKLADWAVHWQVTLPGCMGSGIFGHGTFILHNPVGCLKLLFVCIKIS